MRGKCTYTDASALVETGEDHLGSKTRTLVTQKSRLCGYSGHDYGESFDFEEDPHELNNLWNDLKHRALRDELRIQLLDRITRTDISVPRQISRA